MSASRPPATTANTLALVQRALDEFEDVSLEASIRRAIRIANLMGDTYAALRLAFEIKPSGGHPPANADMTRRLMADPGTWDDKDGVAERALEEYMAERRLSDDLITAHSIELIQFWQRQQTSSDALSPNEYKEDVGRRLTWVELVARARHKTFTYLCAWERQLTFESYGDDAFATASQRVGSALANRAPDVLDRFNVAFRRLREAADRDSEIEASEELSQALASCRRILKAIVDLVQPADPSRTSTEYGHSLMDESYKNRLVEFLKANVDSRSFRGALEKHGESLFTRFSAIDSLSSKGVHAEVAVAEAEFCALSTYTLAGEILAVAEIASPSR